MKGSKRFIDNQVSQVPSKINQSRQNARTRRFCPSGLRSSQDDFVNATNTVAGQPCLIDSFALAWIEMVFGLDSRLLALPQSGPYFYGV